MLGHELHVNILEEGKEHIMMIPKFTAKFFAFQVKTKNTPLFVRIVRDWEENCKLVGQSRLNYQDLEVYWSET
jgi:hypothetical protein